VTRVARGRSNDESVGPVTPFSSDRSTMTTLGPSLTINGDLTSQEDMTIHGTVTGQINMQKGVLVIAPSGTAEANVQGSKVTVHGKISGDISVTETVELSATANVSGTISAPSLVLHEGATFNGIIDMSGKKAAKTGPKLVETASKAS
jgi:cytoskeletal protein CcmA (bactofilin family)